MRPVQLLLPWLAFATFGCSFDWDRYSDPHASHPMTCATGVSDARIERLARGIDLYGWLTESTEPEDFISDVELTEMSRMGISFVRASFLVSDPATAWILTPESLTKFGTAIDRARAANLGIVFVPYFDSSRSDFKQRLGSSDPSVSGSALEQLLQMWSQFADSLRSTDPDWVFLELMGAPDFADHATWNQVMQRLAGQVRQRTSEHTIIADANSGSLRVNWASVTALSTMPTVPDERNIVYGFIFFDPVIFTHQGATWRPEWPELAALNNLPYPSSPTLVAPALAGITDEAARGEAESYGRDSFGPELLSLGLDKVAAWSQEHCARIMCVEFGAYRAKAPADSTARWVADVRKLFDMHRIGWAYWSYRERMGIAAPRPGPVIDLQIGTALGLKP